MKPATVQVYRSMWKKAERELAVMAKNYLQEKHRRDLLQGRYDSLLKACSFDKPRSIR